MSVNVTAASENTAPSWAALPPPHSLERITRFLEAIDHSLPASTGDREATGGGDALAGVFARSFESPLGFDPAAPLPHSASASWVQDLVARYQVGVRDLRAFTYWLGRRNVPAPAVFVPNAMRGQNAAIFARHSAEIIERERAYLSFALSRPPMPVASWLGMAPDAPAEAEWEAQPGFAAPMRQGSPALARAVPDFKPLTNYTPLFRSFTRRPDLPPRLNTRYIPPFDMPITASLMASAPLRGAGLTNAARSAQMSMPDAAWDGPARFSSYLFERVFVNRGLADRASLADAFSQPHSPAGSWPLAFAPNASRPDGLNAPGPNAQSRSDTFGSNMLSAKALGGNSPQSFAGGLALPASQSWATLSRTSGGWDNAEPFTYGVPASRLRSATLAARANARVGSATQSLSGLTAGAAAIATAQRLHRNSAPGGGNSILGMTHALGTARKVGTQDTGTRGVGRVSGLRAANGVGSFLDRNNDTSGRMGLRPYSARLRDAAALPFLPLARALDLTEMPGASSSVYSSASSARFAPGYTPASYSVSVLRTQASPAATAMLLPSFASTAMLPTFASAVMWSPASLVRENAAFAAPQDFAPAPAQGREAQGLALSARYSNTSATSLRSDGVAPHSEASASRARGVAPSLLHMGAWVGSRYQESAASGFHSRYLLSRTPRLGGVGREDDVQEGYSGPASRAAQAVLLRPRAGAGLSPGALEQSYTLNRVAAHQAASHQAWSHIPMRPEMGQITLAAPPFALRVGQSPSTLAVVMELQRLAQGAVPLDERSLARLQRALPGGVHALYPALPAYRLSGGAINIPIAPSLLQRLLERGYSAAPDTRSSGAAGLRVQSSLPLAVDLAARAARMGAQSHASSSTLPARLMFSPQAGARPIHDGPRWAGGLPFAAMGQRTGIPAGVYGLPVQANASMRGATAYARHLDAARRGLDASFTPGMTMLGTAAWPGFVSHTRQENAGALPSWPQSFAAHARMGGEGADGFASLTRRGAHLDLMGLPLYLASTPTGQADLASELALRQAGGRPFLWARPEPMEALRTALFPAFHSIRATPDRSAQEAMSYASLMSRSAALPPSSRLPSQVFTSGRAQNGRGAHIPAPPSGWVSDLTAPRALATAIPARYGAGGTLAALGSGRYVAGGVLSDGVDLQRTAGLAGLGARLSPIGSMPPGGRLASASSAGSYRYTEGLRQPGLLAVRGGEAGFGATALQRSQARSQAQGQGFVNAPHQVSWQRRGSGFAPVLALAAQAQAQTNGSVRTLEGSAYGLAQANSLPRGANGSLPRGANGSLPRGANGSLPRGTTAFQNMEPQGLRDGFVPRALSLPPSRMADLAGLTPRPASSSELSARLAGRDGAFPSFVAGHASDGSVYLSPRTAMARSRVPLATLTAPRGSTFQAEFAGTPGSGSRTSGSGLSGGIGNGGRPGENKTGGNFIGNKYIGNGFNGSGIVGSGMIGSGPNGSRMGRHVSAAGISGGLHAPSAHAEFPRFAGPSTSAMFGSRQPASGLSASGLGGSSMSAYGPSARAAGVPTNRFAPGWSPQDLPGHAAGHSLAARLSAPSGEMSMRHRADTSARAVTMPLPVGFLSGTSLGGYAAQGGRSYTGDYGGHQITGGAGRPFQTLSQAHSVGHVRASSTASSTLASRLVSPPPASMGAAGAGRHSAASWAAPLSRSVTGTGSHAIAPSPGSLAARLARPSFQPVMHRSALPLAGHPATASGAGVQAALPVMGGARAARYAPIHSPGRGAYVPLTASVPALLSHTAPHIGLGHTLAAAGRSNGAHPAGSAAKIASPPAHNIAVPALLGASTPAAGRASRPAQGMPVLTGSLPLVSRLISAGEHGTAVHNEAGRGIMHTAGANAPPNARAARVPSMLFPAAGGGTRPRAASSSSLMVQRSAVGSSPAGNAPGESGGGTGHRQETTLTSNDKGTAASEVYLLANEVWAMLKRRLATEAERRGRW